MEDCDCGCDCDDFCTGFLCGCCIGGCDEKRDCGCFPFFVAAVLILICICTFAKCSKDDPKKDVNGLITYKIVEYQRDWRLFGKDGNTIVENVETGERKTLIGKFGGVGEQIKLKE